MRPPDPVFADPRWAVIYDALDGDRNDLDAYEAIAGELAAGAAVVDVRCGTGSLAVRLAAKGFQVVGVDPARASLAVARTKPYAAQVRWIHGDATALTPFAVVADLVLMTGNVAQVFVDDADWAATLAAIAGAVRPGGWFVFETRRPEARDWEHWDFSGSTVELPDGRVGLASREVLSLELPLVTFRWTLRLGDECLVSTSTLRFRGRDELEADLAAAGFTVHEVREAPDRPGLEVVPFARRRGEGVRGSR